MVGESEFHTPGDGVFGVGWRVEEKKTYYLVGGEGNRHIKYVPLFESIVCMSRLALFFSIFYILNYCLFETMKTFFAKSLLLER